MTTVTGRRTRRPDLTGWSGRVLLSLVLALFVVFFAIPIVWLALAAGKSPQALLLDNPFAPGTFAAFVTNWNQLFGFQNGAVTGWIGN
jgi:multiple sugar transport system permease protein